MLLSILRVSTLIIISSLTYVNAQSTTLPPIPIPTPPGPYASRLEIKVMVDTTYPDPYNSTQKYNRLVVSILTPIPKSQCSQICEAKYMPATLAAFADETLGTPGIFERFRLSGVCCSASPNHDEQDSHDTSPLIIFTPGFKESRLDFSTVAQYLSSYGYKVILVDQPGEANVVEFPDGEVVRSVFGLNPTVADEAFALNVRVQDTLFIIDEYTKGKEILEQR
jgi:hypothetical protein